VSAYTITGFKINFQRLKKGKKIGDFFLYSVDIVVKSFRMKSRIEMWFNLAILVVLMMVILFFFG